MQHLGSYHQTIHLRPCSVLVIPGIMPGHSHTPTNLPTPKKLPQQVNPQHRGKSRHGHPDSYREPQRRLRKEYQQRRKRPAEAEHFRQQRSMKVNVMFPVSSEQSQNDEASVLAAPFYTSEVKILVVE